MTLIKWPVYANGYTAVAQHGSGSEEIPHIQGQRSPSKMVGAGVAAAQHSSDSEEIPHFQELRRSPSKTVGTGMVAAWHESNFEEIAHVQGQRRSPSKMVGGAKSRLESNPIPAEMLRGSN